MLPIERQYHVVSTAGVWKKSKSEEKMRKNINIVFHEKMRNNIHFSIFLKLRTYQVQYVSYLLAASWKTQCRCHRVVQGGQDVRGYGMLHKCTHCGLKKRMPTKIIFFHQSTGSCHFNKVSCYERSPSIRKNECVENNVWLGSRLFFVRYLPKKSDILSENERPLIRKWRQFCTCRAWTYN